MNEKLELKPCPFCGEKEKIGFDFYDDDSVCIECWGCLAHGTLASDKTTAIEAWNRRANDDLSEM